ncbi:MAG: polysaccharide biosynthesis C-terminal domain-containing protein [Clostridia bacterium]|nr:polysaccharide biosynthesis C-terminal domain-containing protein [Clostridia bacterium]
MSKRARFFYNGLLLSVVGLVMRAVGLFLGAYISGAIGAEGVGLQSLIGTVYSFAVTLATSGVSLSVTRLVAASIGEGGGGGERILRGAFLYAFLFGAGATLLLLLLAEPIGLYILDDTRVASALRILSLSLLPIALSSVISGYFVAVRRVALNAAVQVLGQILRIGMTVVLLLRFAGAGVEAAVMALAIGSSATELICFLVALVEYLFDRRRYGNVENKGYATAEVAKMALPLAFSQYVRSFLLSVEHSLIPRRLIERGNSREEALSSYGYLHGMALPIILFPMTPLGSFSGLLVPEFAESEGAGDRARMERIASEAISKTLGYAVMMAVFIFAFSEELGYVIYGTYEAGHFIGFLAPVIPLMYLDHVTDSMLKGIGEHVYSMWVNIADSFLSVLLVYLLIPVFDISGYALVIIIMELFNFVLSFLRLRKRIAFKTRITSALFQLCASLLATFIASRVFIFSGEAATMPWLVMKLLFAFSIFVAIISGTEVARNIRKKKTIIYKT